jgi:hypothetical protein
LLFKCNLFRYVVVLRGWADVTNPNGTNAGQCNSAGGLAFKWTVRKAGEAAVVNFYGSNGRTSGSGVTGLEGPVLTIPPQTLEVGPAVQVAFSLPMGLK